METAEHRLTNCFAARGRSFRRTGFLQGSPCRRMYKSAVRTSAPGQGQYPAVLPPAPGHAPRQSLRPPAAPAALAGPTTEVQAFVALSVVLAVPGEPVQVALVAPGRKTPVQAAGSLPLRTESPAAEHGRLPRSSAVRAVGQAAAPHQPRAWPVSSPPEGAPGRRIRRKTCRCRASARRNWCRTSFLL